MDRDIAIIEESLRVIDFHIRKKGREVLKNYDMTDPQFRALQILLIHGDSLTMGDLTSYMSLATSTVNGLVQRMEQNNLVRRVQDREDGRVVRVEVLMKGHDVITDIVKIRREFIKENMKQIALEGRKSLVEYLPQLVAEFRKNATED